MLGDLRTNSFFLGHLLRIPVFAHGSAVLMLLWAYLWAGTAPGGVSSFEWYMVVLISLLLGLVLHEIGHALAFRWFGNDSITIVLTGFGGLCLSDRRMPTASGDLLVVASGPAMNLALFLLFMQLPGLVAAAFPDAIASDLGRPTLFVVFCNALQFVNLMLFIINIMPIYPLDGGRMLYNGVLLVSRNNQTLARQVALVAAVIGAIAWFSWSTGLLSVLLQGQPVSVWLSQLGPWDLFFAVILFLIVRSAVRQLG